MPCRRTFIAAGLSALAEPAWAAEDYAAALGRAYGGPVSPAGAQRRLWLAANAARNRADVLLRGQGLASGSVAERLRTLAADPRWLYPDDDAGRDRAVAEMNARLAAIRPRLRL